MRFIITSKNWLIKISENDCFTHLKSANLQWFILLLAALMFSSCKNEKSEIVKVNAVSKYVLSHNKDRISPHDNIYIKFNYNNENDVKAVERIKVNEIRISPKVKGEFKWLSSNTIQFYPSEGLRYNQTYKVDVNINTLLNVQGEKDYNYSFTTEAFVFDAKKKDLLTKNDDEVSVLFEVISNARISEEDIVDYFSFSNPNSKHKISNFINESNHKYTFQYGPIKKIEKAQNFKVSYSFKNRNEENVGDIDFRIPAIGEFVLLDVKIDEEDKKKIIATFSNALKKQSYKGKILIKEYDGDLKFSQDKNKLFLFIGDKIQGKKSVQFLDNILDSRSRELKGELSWELMFQSPFPQLKTSTTGTILPYENQVLFPFSAIALDSVELRIMKVFENNVLDFLRYNKLDYTYLDDFLGREVYTENIALNSISSENNSDKWIHYALDIKDLIDAEPGAIYQIKIGFKKSFTKFNCTKSELPPQRKYNQSSFTSYPYYSGYKYEHRDDPCYPSYYNGERFIVRNLLASNLGLIAKRGKSNNLNVAVSNLKSGQPIPNVRITLYDKQQQKINEINTNGQGIAEVNTERKVFNIVAQMGNEYGYLTLNDNQSNKMSNFDVGGINNNRDYSGFIYGERGVWRPGDTIHLTYMLYDSKDKITSQYPVRMTVKDSRGKIQYDAVSSDNIAGIYVFSIPTSANDPTGLWNATAELGNYKVSKRIKVETIKPNRLKIDVITDSDELNTVDNEGFRIESKWLHGAPASNLKANVDVQFKSQQTTFNDFVDYEFNDPSRKLRSVMNNIFKGKLNQNGETRLSLDLPKNTVAPGKLLAKVRTRVFEKSGNFSEDFNTIKISPYSHYAGVLLPTSRWGSKSLNVKNNESIKFQTVDSKGKKAGNRKVSVGVYEASWRWWYNRNDYNLYRYNTAEHFEAIDKKILNTAADGSLEYVPKLNGHGRYLVRVCDVESGHCSGDLFYTRSYNQNNNNEAQLSTLNFETDKDTYSPGEQIQLDVPSNEETQILVSIENGQEVLDAFWVESTGSLTRIPFKVNSKMVPNIYIHVTLIQKHNKSNDLPMRMYGVQSVNVVDKELELKPQIQCAESFKPNSTVDIKVSEINGQEMAYTLAVVDEGLLDITNFKTPAPHKHFFAKQALGVRTWDVYDYVLNNYGGQIEKVLSIGGDGDNNQEVNNPTANRFIPVVSFLGPFELKKGEETTHQINLPNYIGAVRVMIVAKNKKALGHAEKLVTVKQPLMLLSTMPRVLSIGDLIKAPVNVFAYDEKIKSANVKLESNALVSVEGKSTNSIEFERVGDKLTSFDIRVGSATGISRFNFSAMSNGYKTDEQVEVQVRNPSPPITKSYNKYVKSGEKWSIDFQNIGIDGSNEAYVEISKFPTFNLNKRLDYLIRYPYGCVEQTTSSVFPQLFLDDISKLNDSDKERIKKNIRTGIRRLMTFQNNDGGFSYWPSSSYASLWGTNYAGHFLIEAQQKGFYVSQSVIDNWADFQEKSCRSYSNRNGDYNSKIQAYRLYTLALVNKANLGEMNKMRINGELGKTSKLLLAAAYTLIGQKNVGMGLIQDVSLNLSEYREMGGSYGSALRDKAVVLMALLDMEEKEKAFQLGLDISKQLSSNKWFSTQTTAFSLLALSKLLKSMKEGKLDYKLSFDNTLNVDGFSDASMDIFELNVSEQNGHNLNLINQSEGDMYVNVVSKGKPLPEPFPSYSKGIEMSIKYTDIEGNIIEHESLDIGQDFYAKVRVKNNSDIGVDYEELALNHTLPSCWEVQNLRLSGMNNTNDEFEFQDVRDDAVYTFFDLKSGESKVFNVALTAAYAGSCFLPNVTCEAMYDNSISASVKGGTVIVNSN